MADFPIVIRFDTSQASAGTRTVERGLSRLDRQAQSLGRNLRGLLAFAGVSLGVGQIISLSDSFTSLQNRIRLVTDDTAELNQVTDELFAISDRTRSSFEGTAELYVRTALASRELGTTQEELLTVTQGVNQAIILSGVNAREATNGIIQLSQGIAAGALRGDELRSVLEQLPGVADVIADQLNVTRGELRELGQDGRITSDIIIDAFLNAADRLEDDFATTIPTIGQSFLVLRNQLIFLISELNATTGTAETFSRGILEVAGLVRNLASDVPQLARNLASLGIVIGSIRLAGFAQGLASSGGAALILRRQITLLFRLIRTNPVGLLVVTLGSLIALLVRSADEINATNDGLATLEDFGQAAFEILLELIETVASSLSDLLGGALDGAIALVRQFFGSFEDGARFAAIFIDGVIGLFIGLARVVGVSLRVVRNELLMAFSEPLNEIGRDFTDFINARIQDLNALRIFFGQEPVDLIRFNPIDTSDLDPTLTFENLGQLAGDSFVSGFLFSGAEDLLDTILDRAREIAVAEEAAEAQRRARAERERLSAQDQAFQELLALLRQEADLLLLSNREYEIRTRFLALQDDFGQQFNETQAELVDGLLREIQARQDQAALLDQIRGPYDEIQAQQAALNALLERGAITTQEFVMAMRDLQIQELDLNTDELSGYSRGLLRIQQQFDDIATGTENVVNAGFNALADGLTMFVEDSSTSLRDFLTNISQAVLRATSQIIAQLIIVNALRALGGGAPVPTPAPNPDAFGPGFARGGQFMVAGSGGTDSQNVAFRATPGERVTVETPQQQRASDRAQEPAAAQAMPEISIVNVTDPQQALDAMASGDGRRVITNQIRENASSIRKILGV